MSIGQLYDANNVVVGQAAMFISAANTPLPNLLNANLADPFDPTPFLSYTVTAPSTSTFTLTIGGVATSSLTNASTGAQVLAALEALPAVVTAYAAGAAHITVTPSTNPGPFTVVLPEELANQLTLQVTTGAPTLTGGLWTPMGATDQGWKYNTNKSTSTINIEEQSPPVAETIQNQAVTFEGALAEDISRTLAVAWNGLLTSVAAGASNPAYDNIVLTDTVLKYAVCLVTQHFNGMPRWIYAPVASQLSNVSTEFRRANAKRMYAVSFATLCQPGQIRTINFTGPHS